jgi:hypothetical protein
VDTIDPASIGAVPVDTFDPASIGAVPVEGKRITDDPGVKEFLNSAATPVENSTQFATGLETNQMPLSELGSMSRSRVEAARQSDYKIPSLSEAAMTPVVNVIPKITPEEAGKIANATDVTGLTHLIPEDIKNRVAGIGANVIADTANFFTSPVGIATLGTDALPRLAQKAISAAFLATTLKDAPEQYAAIRDANTPEERDKAIAGAVESAMVIGGTAAHLLTKAKAASAHVKDSVGAKASEPPVASSVAPETAKAVQETAAPETPSTEPASIAPLTEQAVKEAPSSNPVAPKTEEAAATSKPAVTADDWTSATADEPPAVAKETAAAKPESETLASDVVSSENSDASAMRRGGGEAGAVNLPKFEDRKMSELDRSTTERSARLQASFDEATRAQHEINDVAPTRRRQSAISIWMEAGGDDAVLKGWESGAKDKAFRQAAREAQSLTPQETAIAQKAKAAFDALAQRGQKYDVLGSFRDNYVPHVWEAKKGGGMGSKSLQEKFKFSKARTFANFAEGDAAGFKPKTMAIGELLPAYLHEMNKVIADRQFVRDLSTRTAGDGRPLVVPRGRISEIETDAGGKAYLANPDAIKGLKDATGNPVDTGDYNTLQNQPALHDWRWEGKDAENNPIYMRDDLAVHPDAARRIHSMLGKSALKEWYSEETGSTSIPRAIVKALDTAQSVMKREMFGLLAPFHQVQEGTHAIAHRINPFFGIEKVDMRKPQFMDAAQHGLMMLPDRATSTGYLEGLGGKGSFLTQALRFLGEKNENIAGKAATAMANVVDGYQNYLFHQYIPSLKFKTYDSVVKRNMEVYAKELKSGQLTESDVKLLSAEQTNAAYGHLNRDLLDTNPTVQHFKQLALLAPDFLEARARFVGQAIKGVLGSKVGEEQFKAIAFLALVQSGTAFTLSQLTGSKYDPTKPFSVIHGGREYTMRSVPEDLLRLGYDLSGTAKGGDRGIPFISARLNPLAASLGEIISGRNYRGEKSTLKDSMEELLAKYIPITARSIPLMRSLTETSRQTPITPLEQLAGSLGLKISRHSPITETYAKASEWMEKNGVPKDKGSYPVSKFQQLRYALEDGDMDRAKEEYDKLAKTAKPDAIAKGFALSVNHNFTKSAAMDAKFRASLSPSDREVYDLAKRKRVEIIGAFRKIGK